MNKIIFNQTEMRKNTNPGPDKTIQTLFGKHQLGLIFRWIFILTLAVFFSATLTQCSEKEDDPIPDDSLQGITISGELNGPAETSINATGAKKSTDSRLLSNSGTTDSSISGEVPLSGIEISLFQLSAYLNAPSTAKALAKVTTNLNGKFSAEGIPENTDILALTRTTPRLSAIYLAVDAQTNLEINSATTLAAEYYGHAISSGETLSSEDLQTLIGRASEITEGMEGDELLNLLSALIPEQFGEGFPQELPLLLQSVVNRLSGIQPIDCGEIIFSATSGKPGTIITLSGLSDEFGEEPYLLLFLHEEENTGKQDAFPVYIERTSSGEAEFAIPINPANPMEGGEVQLVIESEDKTFFCGPTLFTIQPMEASPGIFSSMVDDLESGFLHLAISLGYNAEELLVADVLSLPTEVRGIAFGLQAVAGPNVPNNLRALAKGEYHVEGEIQKIEPGEMELIEAIIAGVGMELDIKGLNKSMLEVDLEETKNLRTQARVNNQTVTPGTLQAMMLLQTSFETQNASTLRSLQNKLKNGIAVIGVGATLMGAAPVAGGAALLGTVATSAHLAYDMGEHLLPSKLADILLEANPTLYSEEDDGSEGSWQAQLVATTNGYKVDLPSTIGALPGWGGASKILGKMGSLAGFSSEGIEIGFNVSKDLASNILSGLDDFGVDIPPKEYHVTFDPNRFGEDLFFDWELRTLQTEDGGPPFIFNGDNNAIYTPRGVGQSEIHIQTTGGLIYKGQVVNNSQILELKPIEIEIVQEIGPGFTTGSPFFLEVGEELPLEALVRNAIEEKVEWTVSPNNGGIEFVMLGPNELTIAGREPGSYIITAESVTRTGARADNQPVRMATAKVVVENLRISVPNCIVAGEFHEFKASFGDEQVSFSELNWTISGPGDLSNTGLYSSSQTGQVQIEFSLKRNEDITAEVSFEVREKCPDSYDIYVEGGPLAGRYFGEIERDDNSDSFTLSTFLNQEVYENLGKPGYTSALLGMNDPVLQISVSVVFLNGVPLPIGNSESSIVAFSVKSRGGSIGGVSGSVSVSNFKTHLDFMGDETLWSGTIDFSGVFSYNEDESIPLFGVRGTFTVMPPDPEED